MIDPKFQTKKNQKTPKHLNKMSSESNQAHSAKTTESNCDCDCDCDSPCISLWVLEFVLFFPCLVVGKIWENEVN